MDRTCWFFRIWLVYKIRLLLIEKKFVTFVTFIWWCCAFSGHRINRIWSWPFWDWEIGRTCICFKKGTTLYMKCSCLLFSLFFLCYLLCSPCNLLLICSTSMSWSVLNCKHTAWKYWFLILSSVWKCKKSYLLMLVTCFAPSARFVLLRIVFVLTFNATGLQILYCTSGS